MQEAIIQTILETEKTGDSSAQRQVQAEAPKSKFLCAAFNLGHARR
jgi:hypothetical protein